MVTLEIYKEDYAPYAWSEILNAFADYLSPERFLALQKAPAFYVKVSPENLSFYGDPEDI